MNLIFQIPIPVNRSSSKQNHGIYIGGKSDAKNRSKLQQLGITHILNMTPEKDASIQSGVANYFEKNKTFIYKRIPIYDTSTTDLLPYAPQIVSFMVKALNYGSILVHCQRGVSRSAAAVMLYLMNVQGMEFDAALNLIKERRECICPIPAFLDQLQKYEMDCKEKGLITIGAVSTPPLKRKIGNHNSRSSSSSSDNKREEYEEEQQGNKKRKAATTITTSNSSIGPTRSPSCCSRPRDSTDEGDGIILTNKYTMTSVGGTTSSSTMMNDEQSNQEVDFASKASDNKDEEKKATTCAFKTANTKSRTKQIGPSLPPGFRRG